MSLNAIHRIRDMEKQISLILKRHKEMIQEETGIKSSSESDMKIYGECSQ